MPFSGKLLHSQRLGTSRPGPGRPHTVPKLKAHLSLVLVPSYDPQQQQKHCMYARPCKQQCVWLTDTGSAHATYTTPSAAPHCYHLGFSTTGSHVTYIRTTPRPTSTTQVSPGGMRRCRDWRHSMMISPPHCTVATHHYQHCCSEALTPSLSAPFPQGFLRPHVVLAVHSWQALPEAQPGTLEAAC